MQERSFGLFGVKPSLMQVLPVWFEFLEVRGKERILPESEHRLLTEQFLYVCLGNCHVAQSGGNTRRYSGWVHLPRIIGKEIHPVDGSRLPGCDCPISKSRKRHAKEQLRIIGPDGVDQAFRSRSPARSQKGIYVLKGRIEIGRNVVITHNSGLYDVRDVVGYQRCEPTLVGWIL